MSESNFRITNKRRHTYQVAEVTAFYAWDAVNKIREKIAQTICKLQKL